MKKGLALTFLIAILVFGAFLRLNHLNDSSLWLDEGITYYNSTAESYAGVWDKTAELDQSPPGYYFITHTYLEIFGENEFGFRLIPLVLGVLSILFLYLLMAAMFDRESGLLAAFLLAANPFHIGFSTESRMYVLLGLFALMGLYFLYKALKSEEVGWIYWLLFILSCIFGLYTHNFFAFVLLAFAFIFLLLIWASEKRLAKFFLGIGSAALVVVCYLPWLPNFLKQMEVERYWMAPNTASNLKEYFLDFSNGNSYILIGFLVLSAIGVIWAMYKNSFLAPLSLVLFLIVGIGAPLTYSLTFEPIMKIRYMVFLVPFWLGLVALGLNAVRKLSLVIQTAIIVLVIYTWVPWQASAFPIEYGEDYRGLVEVVLENPAPVVVHSPSITHVINFYNKGRFDVMPFPFSDDLNEYNIDEDDKSKYRDLTSGLESFYLVITHSHENPHGLLYVWSDEFCDSSVGIDVQGMEVYHFDGCK
jgi:uncharacterized membrane protein